MVAKTIDQLDTEQDYIQKSPWVARIEKMNYLFFWLRWLYPKAKGFPTAYLLVYFTRQKIFRTNGRVGWPVHFTSRILHRKNIEVGNRTTPGVNSGCYIQGKNGIRIGHNCRMGPNVGLISANHDPNDYDRWIPSTPITIGDNVWIGMNSVVLPGVKIGDNVIIGSNSVVSKDIPSNCIAAGAPCKVLKDKPPYTGFDYASLG